MARKQEWTVNIKGKKYHVVFSSNPWTGRITLIINDRPVMLQTTAFRAIIGTDQGITIGDKECRFVLIGRKADIAIDGVFIDSKKEYVPQQSLPWWIWIFIIACGVIPIISMGGALPVICALLGIIYAVRVSVSPKIKTGLKVLYCLGITAAAWALFGLLIFLLSGSMI